ncbi:MULTISPECIES: glutathione-disulfide reductase [Gammaproteobacteria]|uniref:Glutathione-disulfide reductase n=1 Tax=Vreelandella halophila TaxID=86177 RepID=A0A9X4YCR1_9GAMM|nr:glutathione-disulfide reductase [Halospina sp. K52047b]KAA8984455.1 glutathione-disulfide reductase [Halospina sp. K52047b]MYL26790.1 glutathione-disulfide reductase [Halomonas utahensis]MYL74051.1 glutathione-disulfide reductase [Halomonas sp. 22501_18_FS]
MSKTPDYDLVVIGAGSGGVRLARMASQAGARVAIVESADLGGTCVNVGCVPKKLFVYGAHVREDIEDARGYGFDVADEAIRFDWATLRDNKTNEIRRLNDIYRRLIDNAGVTLIEGTAHIEDAGTVRVDGTAVTTERITIATGSEPVVPEIPGSEHALVSDHMFYLDSLPETATVWGGGYIAVEFAGILAGLGVRTTLIYRGERFLRGFDGDIRDHVAQEMDRKGIDLRFNTNIESITTSGGDYELTLTDGSTHRTGLVLAATGRVPRTQGLGLASVGVETDEGGAIITDDQFRTSVPGIHALGDVIGTPQLTPVAIEQAMVMVDQLYGTGLKRMDYTNIPTAVFCQPPIGTVGLTEEEAREAGHSVTIYRTSFRPMKHTLSGREEKALMKLVVDPDTDRVLGAHMVGPEAGEMMQGIAVALKAGATKAVFDATVGIHPTSAEEFVTMREPVSD